MSLFINICMSYITPCISICRVDPSTGVCIGCKRSQTEIDNWNNMTFKQRMEIMRKLGYGKRRKLDRAETLRRYDRG